MRGCRGPSSLTETEAYGAGVAESLTSGWSPLRTGRLLSPQSTFFQISESLASQTTCHRASRRPWVSEQRRDVQSVEAGAPRSPGSPAPQLGARLGDGPTPHAVLSALPTLPLCYLVPHRAWAAPPSTRSACHYSHAFCAQ